MYFADYFYSIIISNNYWINLLFFRFIKFWYKYHIFYYILITRNIISTLGYNIFVLLAVLICISFQLCILFTRLLKEYLCLILFLHSYGEPIENEVNYFVLYGYHYMLLKSTDRDRYPDHIFQFIYYASSLPLRSLWVNLFHVFKWTILHQFLMTMIYILSFSIYMTINNTNTTEFLSTVH